MSDIIKINNFKYQNLFENLNILIKEHSFTAITGPNNCGKTTLIRILNRTIITDNNIIIKNCDINDYLIEEYSKLVQCVIPLEIIFHEYSVQDELLNYGNQEEIDKIIAELKIRNLLKKNESNLTTKEIVLIQIIIALLKKPKILLLDNLEEFLKEDTMKIITYLKKYQKDNDLTIVIATIHLDEIIDSDYVYIIKNGKVELEGKPNIIFEKDNIINKIGLNLPFCIDLSVKLKDYNLLNEIKLDNIGIINDIWK